MPGLHAQVARASPPPHAARGGLLQDSLGWLRAGICVFVFSSQKIERNEKAAVGKQDRVVNLVVNGLMRAVTAPVRALLGLCLYC